MSEQENENSGVSGSPVVMVEMSASSRDRHTPYRPTELQQEVATDLTKRSRAPTVPVVGDELKDIADADLRASRTGRSSMDCDHPVPSEYTLAGKNISSSAKIHGLSTEAVAMVSLEVKKDSTLSASKPIPAPVESIPTKIISIEPAEKVDLKQRDDNDSITEKVTELRTDTAIKQHSEWSDDEEAGGLPRSESRASRVSRAVRQLFCCGAAYHAPSEENISIREFSAI